MKLSTIIADNLSDIASANRAAKSAIDYAINIGERLREAQKQFDSMAAFYDWVEKTHPIKKPQATKYIRIAVHKVQARELCKDEDFSVNDLQKLLPPSSEAPEPTAADANNLAYVGAKPGSRDADDWHTPSVFIEDAREVMGSIDLDPFTSVEANTTVQAKRILTLADNALECTWADKTTRTVWMNPPYAKGLSSAAVEKFLEEYDYGSFDQAVVLMNSSTDTSWFHRMASVCSAVCFTKGRISFTNTDGKQANGNTKGQVFFYFGKNVNSFDNVFSQHGMIFRTGVV